MSIELIAEVSSNHGGDISLAKEFIKRFADAGADWVKFQTTRVKHLRPSDPQYEWFRKAELSDEAHFILKEECEKAGTKFLTTVFNAEEVPFVRTVCDVVKIGSGEAAEVGLAKAVRYAAFSRVLVSLGLRELVSRWGANVEYLDSVSRYPASVRACLAAIDRMGGASVGYSDHSIGVEMPMWAMEQGARIIEKHVQLPNQKRQLQPYEATIQEFKALRKFADDDPSRFIGRWQAA